MNAFSKLQILVLTYIAANCAAFASDQPAAVPTMGTADMPTMGTSSTPAMSTAAVPSVTPEPRIDVIASLLQRINPPGWQPVAVGAPDADADKAATLKEFGCNTSGIKAFQRGQRRINVVLYSFNSSQGAYAAYNLLRRGSSTFVAKGDGSSEDDQSVSIWKDRFFINVYGTSEDDEESKVAVSDIANQLCALIVSHGQLPQIITRLPTIDRVRGSEKVVMGPVSARRLFPAPGLNFLALAGSIGGGVADYQFQAPFRERMKLLVVDYGSSPAAEQAFHNFVDALQEQHPNIAPADGTPKAMFKLANSFLLCELRAQRVIVITGARKRPSAGMLAKQIL